MQPTNDQHPTHLQGQNINNDRLSLSQIFAYYQSEREHEGNMYLSHGYSFSKAQPTQNIEEGRTEQYAQEQDQSRRARTEIGSKLSGVHQKYLIEEVQPTYKTCFRSERKSMEVKKLIKSSKTINHKHPIHKTAQNLFINPLTQGLNALQINSSNLLEEIQTKLTQGDQQKGIIFSSLGLKQPKALGKGRTEHQIDSIIIYLQQGKLPQEYTSAFQAMLLD